MTDTVLVPLAYGDTDVVLLEYGAGAGGAVIAEQTLVSLTENCTVPSPEPEAG